MENQIRVLSTKMLTDQQKRLLLNANFSIDEADFIDVVNQSFDLKSSNDYLIFTSQNAVHSILRHADLTTLQHKDVFCVGTKTKALTPSNGNRTDYLGFFLKEGHHLLQLMAPFMQIKSNQGH